MINKVPTYIGGAKTLFISRSENYFENVFRNDIEIGIKYLAVCKYENEDGFYLFGCDLEFNTYTDYLFDDLEDVFEDAKRIYKTKFIIWSEITQ